MAPWPRAPVIPQLVDRKTFRDNRWVRHLSLTSCETKGTPSNSMLLLMPPDRSNIRSRPTKFIAANGCIFTPGISISFEHHADGNAILLDSTPILRKNILWVVMGLPPHFSFHQPNEGLVARWLF
ncbi:hypothetical protein TNCV_441251 [Trichonephila clavipes]|nr:hypothetical protein TNCV_441251 [Trichonephila clavipes]